MKDNIFNAPEPIFKEDDNQQPEVPKVKDNNLEDIEQDATTTVTFGTPTVDNANRRITWVLTFSNPSGFPTSRYFELSGETIFSCISISGTVSMVTVTARNTETFARCGTTRLTIDADALTNRTITGNRTSGLATFNFTGTAAVYSASWSTPNFRWEPVNEFTLRLSLNENPGSSFNAANDISVIKYRSNTVESGYTITSTGRHGSRDITATPDDTIEFGYYKFRLKANAFGTGKPASDVDSDWSLNLGAKSLSFEESAGGRINYPAGIISRDSLTANYTTLYVVVQEIGTQPTKGTVTLKASIRPTTDSTGDITLTTPPDGGYGVSVQQGFASMWHLSFYKGVFYSIWTWGNNNQTLESHNSITGAHISRLLTFPTSASRFHNALDMAIDDNKIYFTFGGSTVDVIMIYNRSDGTLDRTLNIPTDVIPMHYVNSISISDYNSRILRRRTGGITVTSDRIYVNYFHDLGRINYNEAFRIIVYDKSYNRQRLEESWFHPEDSNFSSVYSRFDKLTRFQNYLYGARFQPSSGIWRMDGIPIGDEEVATPTISVGGNSGRDFYFTVFWVGVGESQYSQFTLSDVRVDSPASATRTVGTRSGNSFPVTVTVPSSPNTGTVKITVLANAILGSPVATSTCVPYDLTPAVTEEPPSITIDSGYFNPDTKRISWTVYITGASSTQISAFANTDVTLNNSVNTGSTFTATKTTTRSSSTESSFVVLTGVIPDGRAGSMSIEIGRNVLGTSSNPFGVTSSCVEYNTVTETAPTPAATIDAGVFNPGDNTIKFTVRWTNATSSQLSNFTADDINISGATGATNALTAQGPNTYVVTISDLPTNSTGNAQITIVANALGTSTNASIQSTCVNYDTRSVSIEGPIPEWTIPTGTQTTSPAQFEVRFVNNNRGTVPVMGLSTNDFSVEGLASSTTITLSSAVWEITLSAAASGLSARHISITDQTVSIVTRAPGNTDNTKFEIVLAAGTESLCNTSITINQTDYPGVTVTSTTIRGPYYIDVPFPDDSSGSFSLRLEKNAVTAISTSEVGPITDSISGSVFYDTRTSDGSDEIPQAIITSGGFCKTSRTMTWRVFWINATTAEMNLFDHSDVTVNLSAGTEPTLSASNVSSRQGNLYVISYLIPENVSGNTSITIRANALGSGTNVSINSTCVEYNTNAATVSTATWSNVIGGTGVQAALYGRITFAGSTDVQGIEPGDFDIFTEANSIKTVYPEAGFSISVSHSITNSSRPYVDVTATPNGPFNTSFGLRLKATSVRSDESITDNAPAANVDSPTRAIDNRPTEQPITAIIESDGVNSEGLVTWRVFWLNATNAQMDMFDAADVTVNVSEGTAPVETVSSRSGNAFTVTYTIPAGRSGTTSIEIASNALGTSTNVGITSTCVLYDTTGIFQGEWLYANWCPEGNRIEASIQFNKAITGLNLFTSSNLNGDIQVLNNKKRSPKDGWTFSFSGNGGSGNAGTLAANTPLVLTITPPANTNETVYLVFNQETITSDSETVPSANIYTEAIPVDNRPSESLSALTGTWEYASYCRESDRIQAAISFNKSISKLDVRTSSADNRDIIIQDEQRRGPLGTGNLPVWTFSFGGHTQPAMNPDNEDASLTLGRYLTMEIQPPSNINESVYLTFDANSVRFDNTRNGPSYPIVSEVIEVNNIREPQTITSIPYVIIDEPNTMTGDITDNDLLKVVSGANVVLTIKSEVDGIETNIDGLEASDFIITGPDGAITPTVA